MLYVCVCVRAYVYVIVCVRASVRAFSIKLYQVCITITVDLFNDDFNYLYGHCRLSAEA